MARDPAFLFYDGDAARDVSHLNRLERGCYFDFMQAQRKFGRMKEDVISKVLGKDFESCWPILRKYFGQVRPAAMMISAQLLDPRIKIEIEVTAMKQSA